MFSHNFFIDITPAPVFAWFERLNNRVFGGVVVFCSVLIGRGIAAANMAANQADAQVNPAPANFQTIFATLGAWRYFADLVSVGASHGFFLVTPANGQ
jgi:enamine deaminase RidA (YjgF/YER057c/UK114 family)